MGNISDKLKQAEVKTLPKNDYLITAAKKDDNNVQHVYVKDKVQKSTLLFCASFIATICIIYLISYMANTASNAHSMNSAQFLGTSIGIAMASPSIIVSGIGTLFSWLGFFGNKKSFALVAGILFAVSMLLMIPWFMFNVVQMILCFIAYAKMKK